MNLKTGFHFFLLILPDKAYTCSYRVSMVFACLIFSHISFNFSHLLVVPPLKFGSLVDSKPFSDEESSMITQSMPTEGPKVPLNGKNKDP